jgi:hypothetical protein
MAKAPADLSAELLEDEEGYGFSGRDKAQQVGMQS